MMARHDDWRRGSQQGLDGGQLEAGGSSGRFGMNPAAFIFNTSLLLKLDEPLLILLLSMLMRSNWC
jgi:hypothetical protein